MTRVRALATALVALAASLAGCAAEGASPRNFTLEPNAVGWFAGDEASFDLTLSPSLTRGEPSVTLDRRFVLEEIILNEQGASFGGDHRTRDPDAVRLRLIMDGEDAETVTLDAEHPTVELRLTLPQELRDSQYVLELKLFQVGWVKSDSFRVDRRA
jgi:hypothetical protein